MDDDELKQTLEQYNQNFNGLMDNQLALTAQVQVLQAALASALMHHPDRAVLRETFTKYMQISRQSAPQLASRMEALEAGMLALLGQHQA